MLATTTTGPADFLPRLGRSVSIEQAASLLGVSRRTIYNRIRAGHLQTVRTLGTSQRVLVDSLRACAMEPPEYGSAIRTMGNMATMVLAAVMIFSAALVEAGPRRASVSRRVTDELSTKATADVIVHGDAVAVQGLARRHGVRIKKYLTSGAVLETDAAGLESLAGDPTVDHVASDGLVQASMAVSTESIGADQVWAGLGTTARRDGTRHHGGGDRLGHRRCTPPTATACSSSVDFLTGAARATTSTGTARTWRGSSRAAGRADYSGMAPGATPDQPARAGRRRLGADERRDRGDRLGGREPAEIQHPGASTCRWATPVCGVVARRSAGARRWSARRPGSWWWSSAGNQGKNAGRARWCCGSITSPGNAPHAHHGGRAQHARHGASASDDTVATYSSRGPTAFDVVLKPDLVAPGNKIVSA